MLGYLCSCIRFSVCLCVYVRAFHKRQRFTLEILRSGSKRDGYIYPWSDPACLLSWHKHVGGIRLLVCVPVCVTGPTGSTEILLQYRSLMPEDWHAAFLVLGLVLHIFEFYFNFFLLYFSCQAAPFQWGPPFSGTSLRVSSALSLEVVCNFGLAGFSFTKNWFDV